MKMKTKLLLLTIAAIVATIATGYSQKAGKQIKVTVENLTNKVLMIGSFDGNKPDNLTGRGKKILYVSKGITDIPITYQKDNKVFDTFWIPIEFKKDGDNYQLTQKTFEEFLAARKEQSDIPMEYTDYKGDNTDNNVTTSKKEAVVRTVGRRYVNELSGPFYMPVKKLGLASGKTSKEAIYSRIGQGNEPVITELNNLLSFTEIRDYTAPDGERYYVIDNNKLLEGQSTDSVELTLRADQLTYAYLDPQGQSIQVIKPVKGRGAYSYTKKFREGVNTIAMKILENGVEKIRYYTFIASQGDKEVIPDWNSLKVPKVFYGDQKLLPITGFDKNCFIALLDSTGRRAVWEQIKNANDTTQALPFFIGMNRMLVRYFEETPQGRIQHSIEFFKLVSESDSAFEIDPKYFWNLEGKLIPLKIASASPTQKFQKIEFWGYDKDLNPKKVIIRPPDCSSETVYVKVGILNAVGYYVDGIFKKSATIKIPVALGDKNKTIEISNENIDRMDR